MSNETTAPVFKLNQIRPQILEEVMQRSFLELAEGASPAKQDLLLGEALYLEKVRIKQEPWGFFTQNRLKRDRKLWSAIQTGLLKPQAIVDRKDLLRKVLEHYGEEIGGHFNEGVYRFATKAFPWGLSWMLNAVSVHRFIPGKFKEHFDRRISILGEVEQLQKLSKKGTILLVPTHQSNLDSPLLGYVIYLMGLPPFSYGGGLNLFTNPILNFFMSNLGAYTVDRRKSNEIYKSVLKNYSTTTLKHGIHSVFFPGGGRARSGAVEKRLKLGLLGTALQAQAELFQSGSDRRVYIVPMTTSYHFVLEASSLIEDFLMDRGKSRYIIMDDESWQFLKVIQFFKKFVLSESNLTVRIGKALDVFGNFVDEEGQSIGPHHARIDPKKWLTSQGKIQVDPDRDHEYTKILGHKLVDRFHRETVVLSSHAVAYAYFELLREKYPELDLYRFLRLSLPQRSMPYELFEKSAVRLLQRLREQALRGELCLSSEFDFDTPETWIHEGVRQLGMLHDAAVVKIEDGVVFSEEMNLLYYYRNRLTGYQPQDGKREIYDGKGFLV